VNDNQKQYSSSSSKNNNDHNDSGDDYDVDQKQDGCKIVRGSELKIRLSIVTGRMCTWWKWAQNRLQDDLEPAGTAATVAAVAMRRSDLHENKTK